VCVCVLCVRQKIDASAKLSVRIRRFGVCVFCMRVVCVCVCVVFVRRKRLLSNLEHEYMDVWMCVYVYIHIYI